MPNNYREGVLAIHIIDNYDWENKTFKGRATHNINFIIIPDIVSIENFIDPLQFYLVY